MRPPEGLNFRVATRRMPKSCAKRARLPETTVPSFSAEFQYWSRARPILCKPQNLENT